MVSLDSILVHNGSANHPKSGGTRYPGPKLDANTAATFQNATYTNKQLTNNTVFYKYHGADNRAGRKISWVTNRKYSSELDLRQNLAIRDDWGVNITSVSEFNVPKGTWISEGKAASQGKGYEGGGYQAVITNIPKAWVIKTDKAFTK